MDTRVPRILLVDDEPDNLLVLKGLLAPLQYDLLDAGNGQDALDQVEAEPPDLILLDVMMPGLSGYDVCQRLKSQPATGFIPIVLVTALTDQASKIRGVEAGADDFLNKPVDPNELRARVRSLLRARSLYDELQQRYEDLRQLEGMRESLTHMIVHDLRNSMTFMNGYLDMLKAGGYISKEEPAQRYIKYIELGAQTLMDMINAILDLAKLKAGKMQLKREPVDLHELVSDVQTGAGGMAEELNLTLLVSVPDVLRPLHADREILRRILVNLISNAIKFSPEGGRISIIVQPLNGSVRIAVQDEGPGIPPAYREHIFEKFGQIESRQMGQKYTTGLGLTFCKMAVEAHGGAIGVDSEENKGSLFWFTVPAN